MSPARLLAAIALLELAACGDPPQVAQAPDACLMENLRVRAAGIERIGMERIDTEATLERRRIQESACLAELACRKPDPALAGPLLAACLAP